MSPGGIIALVVILFAFAALVAWIVLTNVRARRLGIPPPAWTSHIPFIGASSSYGIQPAPGGFSGWVSHQMQRFRNRNSRTAMGAYEGAAGRSGRAARHGFGPLDPDDAWDARVGAEADAYYYNEEQELGLHGAGGNRNSSRLDVSNTSYLGGTGSAAAGSTYDMNVPVPATAHAMAQEGPISSSEAANEERRGRPRNPFDDDADSSNVSLRGVSPRPMADRDVNRGGTSHRASGSNGDGNNTKDNSASERRSIFQENVRDESG